MCLYYGQFALPMTYQEGGPLMVLDSVTHLSFLAGHYLLGSWKKKTNLWVSIDSGAPSNFIDKTLVQKIRLAVEPLPHPLLVSVLDGWLLGSGPISTQTSAIILCLGHHTKRVTQLPELHHILGFPWIHQHNPYIDCSTGSISVWGTQCTQSCLKGMVTPWPTKV